MTASYSRLVRLHDDHEIAIHARYLDHQVEEVAFGDLTIRVFDLLDDDEGAEEWLNSVADTIENDHSPLKALLAAVFSLGYYQGGIAKQRIARERRYGQVE